MSVDNDKPTRGLRAAIAGVIAVGAACALSASAGRELVDPARAEGAVPVVAGIATRSADRPTLTAGQPDATMSFVPQPRVAVSATPMQTPGVALDGTQLSALVDGRMRSWNVVRSSAATETRARRSLVISLHGVGARGLAMRSFGLEPLLADTDVVFAYPDAYDGSWNDGRAGVESRAHQEPADDVAFLQFLIADAVDRFEVDPLRVVLVGFSNGGMLAARFACDAPESVRAVVLVSGSAPKNTAPGCETLSPISALVFHGLGDPVVPFRGGAVRPLQGKRRGEVLPVETLYNMLIRRDRCAGSTSANVAGVDPAVTHLRGTGCNGDSSVDAYVIASSKHEWTSATSFQTSAVIADFVRGVIAPPSSS